MVWKDILYCVLCILCCTVAHRCPCCQALAALLSLTIDAADLIRLVGLHVECQHCHQAQREPNVRIGGIDPGDSTASAQSCNQRPLRSKTMILSWDPRREGRRGGGGVLGRGKMDGTRKVMCGRRRYVWETLKYQRDPGNG